MLGVERARDVGLVGMTSCRYEVTHTRLYVSIASIDTYRRVRMHICLGCVGGFNILEGGGTVRGMDHDAWSESQMGKSPQVEWGDQSMGSFSVGTAPSVDSVCVRKRTRTRV